MVDKDIKQQIEKLDNRRAQILFHLCEDNSLSNPDIILSLVHEIRGITNILKILRKSKK